MDLGFALDTLSWTFIIAGAFFALTGALGILRLPDVFSRMHGAGMVDTLGIAFILVGLMYQADEWIQVVKLGLICIFIFFTSPTTTFALANAALFAGVGSKSAPPIPKPDTPNDDPSNAAKTDPATPTKNGDAS